MGKAELMMTGMTSLREVSLSYVLSASLRYKDQGVPTVVVARMRLVSMTGMTTVIWAARGCESEAGTGRGADWGSVEDHGMLRW